MTASDIYGACMAIVIAPHIPGVVAWPCAVLFFILHTYTKEKGL